MISEHTRLHPADEADLRWRWTQAAGELGERSAMGPMIDRMSEGRTHASGTDPDADGDRMARMMEAAGRVRRIDARLARILLLHQRTLLATYGPGATPGELAGLEWLDSHAIPLSLIRLTARRAGFDIERLRAKGTPPPEVRAPARPDTAGARTSDAKDDPASRRAQADAARQRLAAWKAKRDADVAPLRLAASTALDEACAAYNTLLTETPRPDGAE